MKRSRTIALSLLLFLLAAGASAEIIPFDSGRWVLYDAEVVEHLGRQGLIGSAFLPNIQFENGIIEFDVAVDGSRGYPGIVFRGTSQLEYENFYFRPHVPNRPDALQYTPVFNGVAGWQLYNGPGFTAAAPIPQNEWLHVKLEVKGARARVFFGEGDEPDLVIDELKHDPTAGSIGTRSAHNMGAVFSNFEVTKTEDLDFGDEPMPVRPYGVIREWELTRPFNSTDFDPEVYPDFGGAEPEWRTVTAEPGGLLDIARFVPRNPRGLPEMVCARVTITAEEPERRKFTFGYSDYVGVFLDGELLFTGNSAYTSRDETFSGIVGLFDTVVLPLRKGDNELLFTVIETFGGWGLIARDDSAVFFAPGVSRLWQTYHGNRMPEAVLFDPGRGDLIVSQYLRGGNECLARVALDGTMTDPEWVAGLSRPTGLALCDGVLWSVTRRELVRIDAAEGAVLEKLPIPGAVFPNDVTLDEAGNVYVSDTAGNRIHLFSGGEWSVWLEGVDVAAPNGLLAQGGELLFGNGGDGRLKAADLKTKAVRTIARFGDGSNLDGLRPAGDGRLIVSDYNGRVFLVERDGSWREIINTTASSETTADLEFIPDKKLLIVPGLATNLLTAYRCELPE